MIDYLALLKERLSEMRLPQRPSEPSKAPFEGFEGCSSCCSARVFSSRWPREWSEGLIRLSTANSSHGFTLDRWRQLIDDGHAFLEQWGQQAARLGWQDTDLFGVHPTAPSARFDAMGLVPLMAGRNIIAMTTDTALLGTRKSPLTYRRGSVGAVCLWELIAHQSGTPPTETP
jgi:hypothetical protein